MQILTTEVIYSIVIFRLCEKLLNLGFWFVMFEKIEILLIDYNK